MTADAMTRVMEASRVSCSNQSPFRQECLGLSDFRPLGIGILGQVGQLAEIVRSFLTVACRLGRTCSARECAEAVRGLLERGLELFQSGRRLPSFEQQLPQQLAERIEAIFH